MPREIAIHIDFDSYPTIPQYALVVNQGTGDGAYFENETPIIEADAPATHYVFSQWTGDTTNIDDVNASSTFVTMPGSNVTVNATYVGDGSTQYTLTVTDGTGDGDYFEDDTPNITADAPATNYIFSVWTGDTTNVDNVNSSSTFVTMPGSNVTVNATYVEFLSGSHGFTSGGKTSDLFYSDTNSRFAFSSNTTAIDHVGLGMSSASGAGQSSSTHGFVSGGTSGVYQDTIYKFAFNSSSSVSDHGDLSLVRAGGAGQSSSTQGFTSGGSTGINTRYDTIDKFDFSSNTTASDHGDLINERNNPIGQSSSTQGFTSGGYDTNNYYDTIYKFDFSSNTTASDHGDLSLARAGGAGQSSSTQGFTSGGASVFSYDTIDKFDFSSNTTASDHGDLSLERIATAGQSSSTQGFTSGGNSGGTYYDTIDKFDFSSNTTASDHGDLSEIHSYVIGHQN